MEMIQIARGKLETILEYKGLLHPGEFFLDYDKMELYVGDAFGNPLLVAKLKKVKTKSNK